jgi:hypothetical protein
MNHRYHYGIVIMVLMMAMMAPLLVYAVDCDVQDVDSQEQYDELIASSLSGGSNCTQFTRLAISGVDAVTDVHHIPILSMSLTRPTTLPRNMLWSS